MEERNKKIRNKVIGIIIFVDLFVLGMTMLVIPYAYKDKNYIEFIAFIVLIAVSIIYDIILFKELTVKYNKEEGFKESEKFVEDNLSTERYVEVVPIKNSNHEDFILGLTDIAEFYAGINEKEDNVEIMVKFNGEDKYRLLEKIHKKYFNYYYKIKHEKGL